MPEHDGSGDPVKAAHSLGIDIVSQYWEEVTPELVEEAHEFGMKVIPWTIKDYLESVGEKIPPEVTLDLPYHLEPDHLELPEEKAEGGMDSAY